MKYALLLLFLGAQFTYGQYSLVLHLEKGNTYTMNITAGMRIMTEMNGKKFTITSEMSGRSKLKVVQASDQQYVLEASYDSMHVSIQSPMGRMEFSTGPSLGQDNDMSTGSNMSANKHFNVTVLKNGAIENIDNPDTAGFSAMLKNFPMLDGMKKMMMMGRPKHGYNKQAMKENIEKLTALFPNKKVMLNETWGNVIRPDSGSDNMIHTTYQLTDYKSGVATIKGHSDTKASRVQKPGKAMSGSYDVTGSAESTIQVDSGSGWIKQGEYKSNLKGQLQMSGSSTKDGKSVPFEMISTATISS